jgi:hypothetical protein
MAVLDPATLRGNRNRLEMLALARQLPINYTKAQLNAVFQAIENVYESAAVQNAFSTAIDGALAGLTNGQKRALVRAYLEFKYGAM